jgi:hypothetical protein
LCERAIGCQPWARRPKGKPAEAQLKIIVRYYSTLLEIGKKKEERADAGSSWELEAVTLIKLKEPAHLPNAFAGGFPREPGGPLEAERLVFDPRARSAQRKGFDLIEAEEPLV